ncbi:MAG: hypothetical protein V1781_03400 [Bacteroidota bacterium]
MKHKNLFFLLIFVFSFFTLMLNTEIVIAQEKEKSEISKEKEKKEKKKKKEKEKKEKKKKKEKEKKEKKKKKAKEKKEGKGKKEDEVKKEDGVKKEEKKKKKKKKKKIAEGEVDFEAIDELDIDNDGVTDVDDNCPDTPAKVKVDSKGCPVDGDDDGVPDYLDKEPNTPSGNIVDVEGKTVTDAMIYSKSMQDSLAPDRSNTFQDSIAAARSRVFMKDPSVSSLGKMEADIKQNKGKNTKTEKTKLPAIFQSADANKDGFISSAEITIMIDGFFDGSNDYTVVKIHKLIDYFFEQ